jgi:hypothetical protein
MAEAGPTVLLNKPGLSDSRWAPSDSTGAIGPSHYLEMVNTKIGVYNRAGLSLVAQAEGFIDPQIQWDPQAQRWFYLAIGPFISPDNNYSLAYGWSKTTDPTDLTNGWCRYVLPTTSEPNSLILDDYPKLGHSDAQLVFGTNMFQGAYLGARVWAVPKPQLGVTTCPPAPVASWFALRTPEGDCVGTPVPANTTDSAARAYVVAADVPGFVGQSDCVAANSVPHPGATATQIVAWHVGGPRGSPVLDQDGNMDVPTYSVPQSAPQPGTTDTLDTSDSRLTQAVAHGDPDAGGAKAIWTQHTVDGPGGHSEVRWYELLPASLTVRQQGTIKSNDYIFNAAISPTQSGNAAAIFYNVSSGSQVPQIAAQSRQSGTTLGMMRGESILATSPAAYSCTVRAPNGSCRWGDYSGASPDPTDSSAVWGSNMLGGPETRPDNWRTRNFGVSVGP